MADTFIMPKSIEELYEQYGMKDVDEVYTNGTEFIPVFRLIQFIEMNGYDVPIKRGDNNG